ncbi:proteasome regulatory particle base subunit RPN10 [Rhodotorula paludigena]|uniref:proteasome regulatory particle base subunit RPN10 n=1 Tax=Rhodotorula paludigena TaxID=86838 RepID=UPI00316D6F9A
MSLEATMLVLDNSAQSLNGDFPPNRLQAQADAVFTIMGAKCRAHPENEVGLMVMAGKGPEVLVTLTQDEGKLVAALHDVKSAGEVDLMTGIQVAQLALKHRQNKNQRQRIIVFAGSPIKESQASLVKLGKKLKKNNVALDIISFGTPDVDLSIPSLPSASSSTSSSTPAAPETNDAKLSALVDATSSSDNSHFLAVEPGPHLLSERIAQSPILRPEGGDDDMGGGGAGGAGGAADEFGVDPNLDPELAMALRMSLEEERARQNAAAASSSTSAAAALEPVPEGVNTQITDPTPATEPQGAELSAAKLPTSSEAMLQGPPENAPAAGEVEMGAAGQAEGDEDEDEDLKRALAMSQGAEEGDVEMGGAGGLDETVDEDEDDDIARAIALSMQDQGDDDKKE